MRVEAITPHGFCKGVQRAIMLAHDLLNRTGAKVYGLHEIVHNEEVVSKLKAKGMVFVDSVSEVPEGAVMLVSAHGTTPATFETAKERGLDIVDATCPFVLAGHAKIRENFRNGMRTVVIGAPSHIEVQGYLGEQGACLREDVRPGERTGFVVQTTLDSSEHENVCTATRDRQRAVLHFVESKVAAGIERSHIGVLVIGSAKSSNTGRLVDVVEYCGVKAWRVSDAEDVSSVDFSGIEVLGVTSGASTPETLFDSVMAKVCYNSTPD